MTTQKIQLAIKSSPDELWAALTSAEISPAYYYGFEAHYDLTEGASYSYRAGGHNMITGRLLEVVPGKKLSMTFAGTWSPDVAELPESTVTYELHDTAMSIPGVTGLTLTHEGLPDTSTSRSVEQGWVLILSGLKTLLETGSPMVAPAAA